MKKNSLLKAWIVFGVVMILGIVLFVTTFGGKRYPDQLSEEDIYNLSEDADMSDYLADGTTAVEDVANNAVSTVANGTYSAATGMKAFFQRLFNPSDTNAHIRDLNEQIVQLELERLFADEMQAENERLKKLLGFSESFPQYEYVHANIIANDPNSWFMEFTINRGENHGIVVNSAVVNEDGLVGRIIEVYPNTSKVLSIADPQSAVPVIAERSRDNGVAKGSINPYTNSPDIRMSYLLNDADLVPGDRVVSSSLMEIFPKGIIVGEIREVIREDSAEKYAIITPSVDFAHLENLLIIVGRSNQEVIDESVVEEDIEEESTEEGDVVDEITDDDTTEQDAGDEQ